MRNQFIKQTFFLKKERLISSKFNVAKGDYFLEISCRQGDLPPLINSNFVALKVK
jgi:hypothetical protein